jgi:threonine/homoserine/homoserine lactone efflux protein
MVESWLYIFAVVAVLLIPGPTNALLASAAHHQGIFKALYFVPLELLGYIYGISIWALLVHLTMPIWPMLIHILHIVSAGYVIWMAFHLWKASHLKQLSQRNVLLSRRQLFKSTLKNPKSILFAVGIFPAWTWDSIPNYFLVLGVFSLCLIPCALFWMYFGKKLLAGNQTVVSADRLYKGTAVLLMFSMLPVIVGFF